MADFGAILEDSLLVTTDVFAPVVINQAPAPGATLVSRIANIVLEVVDGPEFNIPSNGVDLSLLEITVSQNGGPKIPAVSGGVIQSGFDGPGSSITPIVGGYEVILDPVSQLLSFAVVSVETTAADNLGNGETTFYTFSTADTVAPFLTDLNPGGTFNHPEADPFKFTVDDADSGVDLTTLIVTVSEGPGAPVTAYDGGAGGFQAGWSGTDAAISATGFGLCIQKAVDLITDDLITINVDVDDAQGNHLATDYFFSTVDLITPGLDKFPPFPLDAFNFLIFELRRNDLQGSPKPGPLVLRRFYDGINESWDKIQQRIRSIPDLWDIVEIDDDLLKFLKNILGWTDEGVFAKITNAITDDQLRRLISVSGNLWQNRGPEQTIVDVMELITRSRARVWNYFDFRWVLDETDLGEEHDGRDPWLIDLTEDDEYRSNLRISDPDALSPDPVMRQAARDLILRVLSVMRPSGEKWDITYLDLLDLFNVPGDDLQWDKPAALDLIVADGEMQLLDDTVAESTFVIIQGAEDWSEYVTGSRIKGNSAAPGDEFGVRFYRTTASDYYEVAIDADAKELRLKSVVSGVPVVLELVDLDAEGLTTVADIFFLWRVEIKEEGALNRIIVFVDGANLIDDTYAKDHTKGTVALFHDTGATMRCDEVELFQLPAEVDELEVNEVP